jgi:hypothetical protein
VHKSVLKRSNELKDKLEKSLRVKDKLKVFEGYLTAFNEGRWPNGVAKFSVRKEVEQQDKVYATGELMEFRVVFSPGATMRQVREQMYHAHKKFEFEMEVQLLKWQLEATLPGLALDAFVLECNSLGTSKRSSVEHLSSQLGIPLDPAISKPDVGLTRAKCVELYEKIFEKVAIDFSNYEKKIESAKKLEEQKIQRLNAASQEELLARTVESAVVKVVGKVKPSQAAAGYDPSKDKHINYAGAYVARVNGDTDMGTNVSMPDDKPFSSTLSKNTRAGSASRHPGQPKAKAKAKAKAKSKASPASPAQQMLQPRQDYQDKGQKGSKGFGKGGKPKGKGKGKKGATAFSGKGGKGGKGK